MEKGKRQPFAVDAPTNAGDRPHMNSRLLAADIECQPGEVRLVDGLKEMCLGERQYGGGCGTIWARPGETVEFAVVGSSWGYFVGVCQAIHPSRKSLSLLIVKGNTG